jgi:hypothetical protein
MDPATVIAQIHEAWREVPYPGDDKIFTPDSYDDEDIGNYFAGTTWRGHSVVGLRSHSSAFSFFTAEAFHYWLPAFMIAAIESPEEADVLLESIAWSVRGREAPRRWLLFSHAQQQAVIAYLKFQIERFPETSDDERKALTILEGGKPPERI